MRVILLRRLALRHMSGTAAWSLIRLLTEGCLQCITAARGGRSTRGSAAAAGFDRARKDRGGGGSKAGTTALAGRKRLRKQT